MPSGMHCFGVSKQDLQHGPEGEYRLNDVGSHGECPKMITTTAKTPKCIKSDCVAIATEIHVPSPPTSTPPWFSLLAPPPQTPSTLSITITLGLRRSAGVLKCVFGYCCSVARTFCYFDSGGCFPSSERDLGVAGNAILIGMEPSTKQNVTDVRKSIYPPFRPRIFVLCKIFIWTWELLMIYS